MDNTDLIWILVPVYNVEKVLDKCIHSIQRQTYTSWKAVLVDDGSTDQSGLMCDEYAKKDSRITVVHTPNGGLPVARMNGIKEIDDTGYCCFCDSDDEMPSNALQLLYEEAKRSDADIVCGNTERFIRKLTVSKGSKLSCFAEPRVYEKEEVLRSLYLCCFGGGGFPVNMWGKLYRTALVREVMLNIESYPKYFGEDLNVTIRVLPEVNRISVINDIVYRYRVGGGTAKFMPTFLDDNILMFHIKMHMADQCTSELDVRQLVGIELKNIVVSYWIMCEKCKKYPQGSLLDEVKAVCALPEVIEAMTMLAGDRSGLSGINQPLIERNYDAICEHVKEKVKKDRPKDMIKKILVG